MTTPADLYNTIQDAIAGLWDAGWTHTDVPAYWRANDADPTPDPATTAYFFRNEVQFGRDAMRAFGGGRGQNERAQFGSVLLYAFVSRAERDQRRLLSLLADGASIFRSVRQGNLSFIGDPSGFDQGPTEDGNWFVMGVQFVFEFRFVG